MARCPFARYEPLPENETQPRIVPTQFILHSAVDHPGPTNLGGWMARDDVKVESHFWITLDGTIVQLMDTEVRADANLGANRRPDGTGAVSVETEDEGNPDSRPWTARQLRALVRLGVWLVETHGIPAVRCPSPDGPGIGHHTMWGAPSKWTSVRGKTCPGRVRIEQFPNVLADIAGQVEGDAPKPSPARPTPEPAPAPEPDEEDIVDRLPLLKRPYGWKAKKRLRADVRRAQGLLAAAGQLNLARNTKRGRPDGLFGPSTEDAVEAFQRAERIGVDGIIGPVTWGRLLGLD